MGSSKRTKWNLSIAGILYRLEKFPWTTQGWWGLHKGGGETTQGWWGLLHKGGGDYTRMVGTTQGWWGLHKGGSYKEKCLKEYQADFLCSVAPICIFLTFTNSPFSLASCMALLE